MRNFKKEILSFGIRVETSSDMSWQMREKKCVRKRLAKVEVINRYIEEKLAYYKDLLENG